MKVALQGVASRVRSLGSAVSLSLTGRGGCGGSPVEALQVMASYIPLNKSARSQQWETGNRPSDLNEACLAAKGSLIRAAQTGHEIQADAQDSQD